MASAPKESFYRLYQSVYESSKRLTRRSQGAFILACAELYFEGKEPTGLSKDARLLFDGTRRRIDAARAVSNGKKNDA